MPLVPQSLFSVIRFARASGKESDFNDRNEM